MYTEKPIVKFEWVSKEDNLWLGIIEISGTSDVEIYRVYIETETYQAIKYSHYKFQRFDFESRTWTMDTIPSNYSIYFFYELERVYFEHVKLVQPENILVSFKAQDKNRKRRMKIYRYFCEKLKSFGYEFIEDEQPTYSALFSYKNKTLLQMKEDGLVNEYLHKLFSYFEFYSG